MALAHAWIDAGAARWVAYELVRYHEAALEGLTKQEVERLGASMQGWSGGSFKEEGGRLAPRVLREVGNKLKTGRKDGRV